MLSRINNQILKNKYLNGSDYTGNPCFPFVDGIHLFVYVMRLFKCAKLPHSGVFRCGEIREHTKHNWVGSRTCGVSSKLQRISGIFDYDSRWRCQSAVCKTGSYLSSSNWKRQIEDQSPLQWNGRRTVRRSLSLFLMVAFGFPKESELNNSTQWSPRGTNIGPYNQRIPLILWKPKVYYRVHEAQLWLVFGGSWL